MLRKMMYLAISVALTFGMTACGSGDKFQNNADGTDGDGNTTINIAALRSDSYLESAIDKYEQSHPGITINLKTYAATPDNLAAPVESDDEDSAKSGGEGSGGGKKMSRIIGGNTDPKDVEKYVNTLNTEIMTGKAPDIISVDLLPYKKYADKNLLADLSELIQSDKSFDMSQYHKGVLDAVKYNGRLYALPIGYTLNMLCGDKTIMDDPSIRLDDSKWTWQDFMEIAEKLISESGQQDISALMGVSELELLNYVMGSSYDKFIDMDKKNAEFNSPEFKEILNFCKELLDKKLVDVKTEGRMTSRGNTLFSMAQINRQMDYLTTPQMQFNGKGKLYNLPGNGAAEAVSFSSNAMLSIYSNSKVKSEAWEFIKYLLSVDVQSGIEFEGFPVNKEALRVSAEKSVEMVGKGMIKIRTPDGEVNLKPATAEDITAMEKALDKVNRYDGADRTILKIILEEAEAFFKGQKSANEVSELIQNRVNTYLKE